MNTATTVLYRKSEHLFGAAQQADLIAAVRGRPVLVEGAVDAIAVNLAGHIGLAAGGTSFTPGHAAALRQVLATTGGPLLVDYDHDAAGTAATVRAADLLGGVDARVVHLPAGADPADVLVTAGPRGLRRTLAVTVPLVEVAVTARLDRWTIHAGNPVALIDAAREVAPLVTEAPAGDRAMSGWLPAVGAPGSCGGRLWARLARADVWARDGGHPRTATRSPCASLSRGDGVGLRSAG